VHLHIAAVGRRLDQVYVPECLGRLTEPGQLIGTTTFLSWASSTLLPQHRRTFEHGSADEECTALPAELKGCRACSVPTQGPAKAVERTRLRHGR
jgi:hypothetical protein